MDVGTAAQEQSTDDEIVAAAQKGDYSAFEILVRRYQDRVYRLAFGLTRSASDAEEVTQDTFLKVFTHLGSFRGLSSPASWIYRITANYALMRLRSRRRKPVLSIEDRPSAWYDDGKVWIVPPGDWSQMPDEKLLSHELGERIESAIGKLPESFRVVLLMRDVEGLSNEEVAAALGVTIGTVKNRLHRSRLFVREELESYFHQ
jgi:RNA polymerase sigma-70 factor (ECF subfamily)